MEASVSYIIDCLLAWVEPRSYRATESREGCRTESDPASTQLLTNTLPSSPFTTPQRLKTTPTTDKLPCNPLTAYNSHPQESQPFPSYTHPPPPSPSHQKPAPSPQHPSHDVTHPPFTPPSHITRPCPPPSLNPPSTHHPHQPTHPPPNHYLQNPRTHHAPLRPHPHPKHLLIHHLPLLIRQHPRHLNARTPRQSQRLRLPKPKPLRRTIRRAAEREYQDDDTGRECRGAAAG